MAIIKTDEFPLELVPAPLLAWYRECKRDLPWRENPAPYRVWVSEIMLQQTRVEAAKEYYLRFLSALPTVRDLADCEEEKLLKLWEGLGYYSRARNLQKTAKIVAYERGGEFPCDPKELQKLPGIGAYTAGAIASIAFGKRTPAVDGNVFRVLSRLMENPTEISEADYRKYLEERLRAVYPAEGAACSDFTQALMELGALVCKPTSPDCALCPLAGLCKARESGPQTQFPVIAKKAEQKKQTLLVFLIKTKEGVCIRKRESGVLKGMYEFPSVAANGTETPESVLNGWGVYAFKILDKKKFTHTFTHIKWEMQCYLAEAEKGAFESVSMEKLQGEISLPTAFRQCLSMLEK